ncbi:MAG: S8 family serine peptidase [Myxococcales bacterium]|nr:S8 family serine peptidase [Myxococcales bacterium]
MIAIALAALPFHGDLTDLVRVEDPNHPDAVARSATGALLVGPPPEDIPWRPASIPQTDHYESEAVAATNADLWHTDGATGQGVRVAVFDLAWNAAETDLDEVGPFTTHDCFASPTCEVPFDPYRPTGNAGGVHGWGCAEAVHDIAPDAELFAVRVNSFTALENAVDWAIRNDIDVISLSMSYYNDSFYDGTGPHAPLMRRLEANDVLMVTSAGNIARDHWSGPFVDSDGDGRLDGDGDNALWIFLDSTTRINVIWNSFGRCSDTNLDVHVVSATGTVIGASTDAQDPEANRCRPVEVVQARAREPDWYRLEISHMRGVRTGLDVSVIARGGELMNPIAAGSITDPGAHPYAAAVGAVWVENYFEGRRERFSSVGPSHAGVPKPDISGPDGLTSAAYGPGGFFGTSASTPVVAGLVAVIKSADPSLTNREAFQRLQAYARTHRGSVAPDPELGAGLARLPVTDPEWHGCGQRPLILPLVLWLPLWRRRRRGG